MFKFEWTSLYHLRPINNLSARVNFALFCNKECSPAGFWLWDFNFFFCSFWSLLTASLSPFSRSQTIMNYPLTLFIMYLLSVDNTYTSSAQPSPLPSLHLLSGLLKSTTTEIKIVQLILVSYDPCWPKRHGQGKIWHNVNRWRVKPEIQWNPW